MSILKATDIRKSYKMLDVVKGISFEINSGEVVGLLGPNGAGKTTAFYIIVGLITSDNGSVFLDDRDITDLSMHQRANLGLGYLPQEASIFRKLTVEENILSILEYQKDLNHSEREQKLNHLLEELHIDHVKSSLGINLSGGERRRVEIARALAAKPTFILLDEPFAGVDPISVLDIQNIIKLLKDQNIGVLITDHNVRETLGICERAYILNEGDLIASGSPEQILSNNHVKEVYLGQDFKL
jgi:lipopolysaccharide export system ATP-binding protein